MSPQQFKRRKKARESQTREVSPAVPAGHANKLRTSNLTLHMRWGEISRSEHTPERLPFQVPRTSGIEQEPQCDNG